MTHLFEEVRLNHFTLKNRLVRSATWEAVAAENGGIRAGVNEAYFAPFAAWLSEEVSTPAIVVGGFRSREAMEEVLEKSNIALISLSRPLLREPDFPEKLRRGESTVSKCVSCNACYSSPLHKCVFRNREEL